jgi:hypothetical protein
MSAFLNITYTFVGQITLPSFIAEMKNPKDFPKGAPALTFAPDSLTAQRPRVAALWAVTLAEIVVFTLCGAIMYHFVGEVSARSCPFCRSRPLTCFTGNQYMTAPGKSDSVRRPVARLHVSQLSARSPRLSKKSHSPLRSRT